MGVVHFSDKFLGLEVDDPMRDSALFLRPGHSCVEYLEQRRPSGSKWSRIRLEKPVCVLFVMSAFHASID